MIMALVMKTKMKEENVHDIDDEEEDERGERSRHL